MPEFIHNFTQGKMNHDLDERMIPNGQYRDALNVTVSTSESSNVGALQNLKGNKEKKGSPAADGDWTSNYINSLTNPVCIGSIRHEPTECIYWFIASDLNNRTSAISAIAEFNQKTGKVTPVIVDTKNILKFDKQKLITGINIVDDLLFFTDDNSEPKKINIKKFKKGSSNGGSPNFVTHTKIPTYNPSTNSYSYNAAGLNFTEADVTVIKKSPLCKPTLTMATSSRSSSGEEVPGTGVSPLNTNYNLVGNFPASGDKYTNFTYISSPSNGSQAATYEPLPTYQEWFEDSQLAPDVREYPANMETVSLVFNAAPIGWEDGDVIALTGSAVGDYNNVDEYSIRLEIIPNGINGNEVEFHIMSTPSTILRFSEDDEELVSWEAILEEKDPMFEFEFPRFAYRWKYENGEYSTFSPFTEPAFEGDDFEYLSSDGYNLGMQNHLRSLIISGFNWGSQEVIEADVLMKKSRSNNIYVVDTLKRQDKDALNVSPPNQFNLKTELIGAVVESNQLLRPWDNVPRKAKAQEVSANRLIFANYLQNFNVPKTKLTLNVSSTEHNGYIDSDGDEEVSDEQNYRRPLPSIKTIRKYQVGIVFQDAYGRQTPVFSNPEATIILDKSNAMKTNKFVVSTAAIPNMPTWPTHYKYFIKDISNEYYNLALDRYYFAEDGNVWLSFPSSEASKVQIDTYLILKKQHDNDVASTGPSRYKILDIQSKAPDFISSSKKVIASSSCSVISGFKEGFSEISFSSAADINSVFSQSFNGDNFIRISSGSSSTDMIGIKSGGRTGGGGSPFVVKLDTPLGSESLWMGTGGLTGGFTVQIDILSEEVDRLPEFEGRVFVKINRDTDFDTNIVKTFAETSKRYGIVASITFNTGRHIMPANSSSGMSHNSTWGFWHGDHGQTGSRCSCDACPSEWRLPAPFNANGHRPTDQGLNANTVPNTITRPNPGFGLASNYLVGCATGSKIIGMVYVGSRDWVAGGIQPGSVGKGGCTGDFWNKRAKQGEKIRIVHVDGRVSEPYEIKTHWRQAHGRGCKYGCPSLSGTDCRDQKNRGGNNRMALVLELDKPISEDWVGGRSVSSMQNIKGYEIVEEAIIDDNSILTSNNPAIFETEPKEAVDIDLYYEASCALPISDISSTNSKTNILDYYNCYSFGNGVESDRIRDDFNAPTIGKGVKVSTILDEPYMEERRSSGLIFSQIYNSTSGINRLNQFIQAEPITKDLNPEYGSIQKLHSRNTNLVTLCEDKCLSILANKDALFNADGSTNITSNKAVLGQAQPFAGEFGISTNPESFAKYGFRSYFTDKNRGAVIRLSQDGITNIALYGMADFFADNLPNCTKIVGSYNDDKENYNVTLDVLTEEWQDKFSKTPKDRTNCEVPNDESDDIETTTVSFKETVNGWTSRKSYYSKSGSIVYPLESGVSLNDTYYTFNKGLIWEHASNSVYNNFYGTQYDTSVNVVINDVTESIKGFKTLNYSGTDSRKYTYGTTSGLSGLSIAQVVDQQITPSIINSEAFTPGWYTNYINTDMEEGQIKEFVKKENKYFNKIKGLNTFYKDNCDNNIDSSAFPTQGLGFATITSSAPSAFNLTINLDTSCSGTGDGGSALPEMMAKFWYYWSCTKPGSGQEIDIRSLSSDQLVKCGIEFFYNQFPNGYTDIAKSAFDFRYFNSAGINVNSTLYNENNEIISDNGKFLYIAPAETPSNDALNANVSGTTVPNSYFIITIVDGVITAKTQYNTLAGCGTPTVAVDFPLFVGYRYRSSFTSLLTGSAAQHTTPSGRAALAKTQIKTFLTTGILANVGSADIVKQWDVYKYSGSQGLVVGSQLHNDVGALTTDGIFAHNITSAPVGNYWSYNSIPSNYLKTDAGWASLDSSWKFYTFENGIVTHITTMNTL